MYLKHSHDRRFQKTIQFLRQHIDSKATILDLGVKNPLTVMMESAGHKVKNTHGEDLDVNKTALLQTEADVVTAFEILEHLLSPYEVLKSIKAQKLVASVPLKLWFKQAYRSKTDPLDRHFHEFEDWQFDWLLEKAGWTIKARKKWTNPVKKVGLRPIFRLFTPRYYIVYCERN